MITQELIETAFAKWMANNPDGTPEEFAKDIGDAIDLILKAEKPEDFINANPA
jgi:hypothetical protein